LTAVAFAIVCQRGFRLAGVSVFVQVVPEGLAATSAAVESLTARLAAAHAGAVPLITAAMPSAAEPASVQTAVAFSAAGGEHAVVAAQGVEELGRSGIGVGASGVSYVTGDAAAASSYWVAAG
jgi:hypothetical protein